MSDFFDRVVARARGAERTIQPLTASRYAPPAQSFPPPEAPAGAREPADAFAPLRGASRAAAASVPSPTEPGPGDSRSQGLPAPRDLPSAGTGGGEVSQTSGEAPPALPSPRGATRQAFDDGAPGPVGPRPPAVAMSDGAPSRQPGHSLAVTAESVEPRRRDHGDRTGPSAADGKIAATSGAAAAEPASSTADPRRALGAERGDGTAQRARDLLADIYYGPAESPAAAEPSAPSTLALGDWSGGGPREPTAPSEPREQGPHEITIAIDRIDVRGLAPPPRPEPRGRRGPRLTLNEYMRQHGRAKR